MISTQAQAATLGVDADGDLTETLFTVKQCNQIANVSKRTIKAAIIGVPIAEVINKFGMLSPGGNTNFVPDSRNDGKITVNPGSGSIREPLNDFDYNDLQALEPPSVLESNGTDVKVVADITAIYKAVNQIIKKHGVVRPQDRVRLNNRVEQQLIECEFLFRKPG